ncbi:thioredoxin family protein [Arcobacter arenosus]|jgi:thioredoxin-related protein|uniref:thioredoxin family protein n=1 Tax=Arcobacter arenosus TaxID=2576037 RepID=UPI003BAB6DA0
MLRLLLISFISTLSLFASINFEKDYNKALERLNSENKELLVMVSSKTCPECNYMKKHIFTQDDVANYINKNYVAVDLDINDKNIPEQMKFWGIPRFYISKDGENVLKKKMGGMKKEQFLDFASKVNQ